MTSYDCSFRILFKVQVPTFYIQAETAFNKIRSWCFCRSQEGESLWIYLHKKGCLQTISQNPCKKKKLHFGAFLAVCLQFSMQNFNFHVTVGRGFWLALVLTWFLHFCLVPSNFWFVMPLALSSVRMHNQSTVTKQKDDAWWWFTRGKRSQHEEEEPPCWRPHVQFRKHSHTCVIVCCSYYCSGLEACVFFLSTRCFSERLLSAGGNKAVKRLLWR